MKPTDDLAPEAHNDEQDDEGSQAQTVAEEARGKNPAKDGSSPTESRKPRDPDGASEQDLVDHMRDMESSGRIDMGAYRGEPNHDDNTDKYGEGHDDDGLRGEGS